MDGGKPSERFPYLKVQEENERLQSRVYELDSALRDAKTRQRFAEEQLPKSVQEVIEDYCNLQRIVRDGEEKIKDYDNLAQTHKTLLNENARLQKYVNDIVKKYENDLAEKEAEIERMRQEYFGDEDFTLRSEVDAEQTNKTISFELNQQKILNSDYLKRITQLESDLANCKQRMVDAENALTEKDALTRTFVLSEQEQRLALRNDELVAENEELKQRYIACNECLIKYMNKLNNMERQMMNAGMSSSRFNLSSSFDVRDKTRVISLLENMKSELLNEKNKNKDLRREVNQLMGKDASTASDESVEAASEAIDAINVNESVDDDKELIFEEAKNVLDDLKKMGWEESLQNTSCNLIDSFANEPPITLGDKESEMLAIFDRPPAPAFLPEELEHISLLNTSMGQILQTSMNAAADITALKGNLDDFRDTLVAMFERLKSSAALFDDIRLLLSDGEHNPLSLKIREMQCIWDSAKEKADQITKAVDTAERSIVGLQAHISVLEHSILQTSFVLDHTRRMTLSNVSFISRLGQGEPNTLSNEDLKTDVDDLSMQLKEVTDARDAATNKVELLEKQLRVMELTSSDLQIKYEQLIEEKERVKFENQRLVDSLTTSTNDCENQNMLYQRASQKLEEEKKNNVNLNSEIIKLKADLDAIETMRDELCRRTVDSTEEIRKCKDALIEYESKEQSFVATIDELNEMVLSLQRDLSNAQKIIGTKDDELDRLHREFTVSTEKLREQLEGARRNADELQVQLSQMGFNNENVARINSTWSPTRTLSSPNSSLLFKSTMPQKYVQTEMSVDDVNNAEIEMKQINSEYKNLLRIHNELEKNVHSLVFKRGDFNPSKDSNTAQANCKFLINGICEKKSLDIKTQEQVEKLEEEIHNRMETSDASRSTKTVTFQNTPVDVSYQDKLRNDVYAALSLMADLTQNLKVADDAYKKNYKFNLSKLVDDARVIRTLLDGIRNYTHFDKENMPQDMNDCHSLINTLRKENKQRYLDIRDLQKSYELLKSQVSHTNNPNIVTKIDKELGKIHDVLQKVRTTRSK